MKEKILQYALIAVASLLVIASIIFAINTRILNKKVDALKRELALQEVKHIIEMDSVSYALTEQMVKAIQARDSLERERFSKLQDKQLQLIKQYEKISADYSAIVIDRPDF